VKRLLILLVLLALGVGGLALAASADRLPAPVEKLLALPERLYTRLLPPQKGKLRQLTEPERTALRDLSRRLDARIVWSSNREGNHDLYLMDLRSQQVRRLTRHPHVDFFSRFSPDGRRIVFLRSQREWVSFRDDRAWDVYLINADGSGERLLTRNGYHPTWTPDGRSVIFLRGPQVFRLDIQTGQEELLLDSARELPGIGIGDVEISPDGTRLALGISPNVGLFDLKTRALTKLTVAQACQTTWAPNDGAVLWVAAEGRGGTRIMRSVPAGAPGEVLMDLPGRYSHEYFPKLSNDGRWLIWGAAAEGHEHDRADYEIFLWEVGTPWENATRLTYYTGNDQWPDIYVKR